MPAFERRIALLGTPAPGPVDNLALGCDILAMTARDNGERTVETPVPPAEQRIGESSPETPGDRGLILVVDDERSNLDSLRRILERDGWSVLTAQRGGEALALVREQAVELVLTDLKMPGGMDGVELMRSVKALTPETEVVLMTAYGTVETAVQSMKEGAHDFITKPFKRMHILKTVRQAMEKRSLLRENKVLRAQLRAEREDRAIIGSSLALRRTLDVVRQAAPSRATVVLEGESGTGKELLARALHEHSPRANKPFIAVNLAALPETIIESELFGAEKGAFTGAVGRRDGRFSLADRGTLFLDEVGEIPAKVQVKLLRVLQEGEFERLGGTSPIKVDVRIVAATNLNLADEVKAGRFRQDLYYRLSVITVEVPPLRERREDIPLLANHFLAQYAERNARRRLMFHPLTVEILERYDWPGNVRELQSVIERAVVLSRDDVIEPDDLPAMLRAGGEVEGNRISIELGTPLEDIERRVIHETLRLTKGDKKTAAQLLGIATRTIYRKL